MPDVLIRNVPVHVMDALKARSAVHRRSLQEELLTVLKEEAREPDARSPHEIAAAIRERLARSGRVFGDTSAVVRDDRER
jgi:plasmid stability protein